MKKPKQILPMHHIGTKDFFFSEEHPVRYRHVMQGSFQQHDHDFYEIAIVYGGTGRHASGNEIVPVKAGDVFIIPIGSSHSWINGENLKLLNILYIASSFLQVVDDIGPDPSLRSLFFISDFFENRAMRSVIHFQIGRQTLELIDQELKALDNPPTRLKQYTTFFNVGCFLKILSTLSEEYSRYYSINGRDHVLSPSVYRMLEILDRSAGRGESPDIPQCASQLGISSKHLNRLFAEEVGVSPHRFFNKRRLIHSRHLILSNAFSITEIAHRLGFADSAHFCRSFKEFFKCTPSQFKLQTMRGASAHLLASTK